MKNKANYIASYLAIFILIELLSLYAIQSIEFGSYWVSFSIGIFFIIVALFYSIPRKNHGLKPIVPILVNAISIAFLANAYLMKAEVSLVINHLFIIFLACIVVYFLYVVSLYIPFLLRHAGWYLVILSLLILIAVTVLWIYNEDFEYSILMFSLIATISLMVCTISNDEEIEQINLNIAIMSFSSIIILIIVLSLLLESGDILEGLGYSSTNVDVNRKSPQNIRF
ncbi:MAG: hypothetical protein JEZ05_01185 [Tenericutes bacterium]|nr:hypothetical protein [Mycoplasmatota bacterium]